MLKPRERMSKKDLKEDKLVVYYGKFLNWFETNSRYVYMGAAILVIVIAGSIFLKNQKLEANNEASVEYLRASRAFDEQKIETAQSMFEGIIDNYGASHYAVMSRFYLAKCLYSSGNYDAALENFKSFLGKYSGQEHFAAAAAGGAAACQEQLGNYELAAKAFEKAANKYDESVFVSEYLFKAARNYQNAENLEKAKSLYQKIVDEYENSTERNNALMFLEMISIKSNKS